MATPKDWLDEEEAKKKKKESEQEAQEQQEQAQAAAAATPVITAPPQNTTITPNPLPQQPASIMGTDELPRERTTPTIEIEGDVANAYNKYIQALQENGNQQSQEVQRLYGEYITALNNAETQRQQGMAGVRKSMQDYLNEGYGAYEAMLKADEDRIKDAEKEAQEQRANEQRAALWTGLGEVAASLVNLGFVGGGNAVSQQYHSYQQDWMKKADENWRRNRDRIDNMRERQRGIQQHMIQMKMNAGQTLANFDAGEVGAAYNHAANVAGAKKDAGAAVANIKGQTAQQTAQAVVQGTTAQVAQNRQDEANARIERHQNAVLKENQRQFDATMTAKGLNPDGTINETLTKQILARQGGGGSGSSSIIAYPILDSTGQVHVAHLHPRQMDEIKSAVQGTIKDELGAEKGKEFEKEFRKAATDKEREAVLTKWMGKSHTAGEMIRSIDAAYKGNHENGQQPQTTTPQNTPTAPADSTKVQVNPRTGLGYK